MPPKRFVTFASPDFTMMPTFFRQGSRTRGFLGVGHEKTCFVEHFLAFRPSAPSKCDRAFRKNQRDIVVIITVPQSFHTDRSKSCLARECITLDTNGIGACKVFACAVSQAVCSSPTLRRMRLTFLGEMESRSATRETFLPSRNHTCGMTTSANCSVICWKVYGQRCPGTRRATCRLCPWSA